MITDTFIMKILIVWYKMLWHLKYTDNAEECIDWAAARDKPLKPVNYFNMYVIDQWEFRQLKNSYPSSHYLLAEICQIYPGLSNLPYEKWKYIRKKNLQNCPRTFGKSHRLFAQLNCQH